MTNHEGTRFDGKREALLTGLDGDERQGIVTRADIRRRGHRLKIDALNLGEPISTEAMKAKQKKSLQRVFAEAGGSAGDVTDREECLRRAEEFKIRAELELDLPNVAAYLFAMSAKFRLNAGADVSETMSLVRTHLDKSRHIPRATPSHLLPEAVLLGVQKRLAERLPLPPKDKVAVVAASDRELLADYALVLPEAEREEFLRLLPEEARHEASSMLDKSVSEVLRQPAVEKGGDDEAQRRKVRTRVFTDLRQVLEQARGKDRRIGAALAIAMKRLGEDTRQLLLELARDEMEKRSGLPGAEREQSYIPHIMATLLDSFDDFRANDMALQLLGDARSPRLFRIALLKRLLKNNYLSKDVGEWWSERKTKAAKAKRVYADQSDRLEVLGQVITNLGVVPSREILEFITDDRRWKRANLAERVEAIQSSQVEFAGVTTSRELAELLRRDEHKAMIYYLLHGGEDHFNLINNYSFAKFKEMLGLIVDLRAHKEPLQKFERALLSGGMPKKDARAVVECLTAGHYPLAHAERAYQETSFDVSENAAVKNANIEIGRVLARDQLGVVLLFPIYREYLEGDHADGARQMLQATQSAHTLAERRALINQIERAYPDFQERAKKELEDKWRQFGEKMVLELSLEQVFNSDAVAVRGEDLLPRLDSKRVDLKRIKKDLLVLLKSENRAMSDLGSKISKKKKARANLEHGLQRQADENKRRELQAKIAAIDKDIADLERQRAELGELKADARFAHLAPEEKREEIDRLSKEIIALTEKSPSAIFTYVTMQVLSEERLRENDLNLIREMESHLQGPFQTIADSLTYQQPSAEKKKRMKVGLRYMDKARHLMHLVRFADSKICCFSSNNYEMQVQHGVPNKYWVASINADPMSFVISMEIPGEPAAEEKKKREVRENIGFIFGNFAVDENGKLAIMLNGLYYAPGIEDGRQVEVILGGVRKIFEGLPIKTIAFASQHGGSVRMPEGYSNDPIELTRLRALDDGGGREETKIYDDMDTGDSLNLPKSYSGHIWHATVN